MWSLLPTSCNTGWNIKVVRWELLLAVESDVSYAKLPSTQETWFIYVSTLQLLPETDSDVRSKCF